MEHAGEERLLATWEAGLTAGPSARALLLHGVARPAAGRQDLLSVPVGRRDAELFGLRRALFGERLDVRVGCPACDEQMEFAFDAGQVAGTAPPQGPPLRVEADGWQVTFRLPTTGDLAAVERAPASRARSVLLQRCVLTAERDGQPVTAERLPARVQHQIALTAASADSCADVRLSLTCPACGHPSTAELDISSYLWEELDAWARATLLDVHLLAAAYGWTEPEILALSPFRRRYYLELCADA